MSPAFDGFSLLKLLNPVVVLLLTCLDTNTEGSTSSFICFATILFSISTIYITLAGLIFFILDDRNKGLSVFSLINEIGDTDSSLDDAGCLSVIFLFSTARSALTAIAFE